VLGDMPAFVRDAQKEHWDGTNAGTNTKKKYKKHNSRKDQEHNSKKEKRADWLLK
jgi:hypothetical protein